MFMRYSHSFIKYFLFISSVLFFRFSFSQQINSSGGFQITSNGNVADIQVYKDALNKADWKCHRFMNSRRVLAFDTGVVVELFSVKELSELGLNADVSCIADEKNSSPRQPVYHLSESGIIIETHQPIGKPLMISGNE